MNHDDEKWAAKFGAFTTITGSVCMLGGAAMLGLSGADFDVFHEANDVGGYLSAAKTSRSLLIANLSIWILGVILIGAGAFMMTFLSRENQVLSLIARYNYGVGIPIVVTSYVAWLAVVVNLTGYEPSSVSILAETMGWFAVRADWVATVLVLGTGPMLISLSGKSIWVPKWLLLWSYLCPVAGILTVIAMFIGGLPTFGFLIIPVGMGWMVASSIVLFKQWKRLSRTATNPVNRSGVE